MGESSGANLLTSLVISCCFERSEDYAKKAWNCKIRPKLAIPICGMLQVSTIGKMADCTLAKDLKLCEARNTYLCGLTFEREQQLDLANPLIFLEKDICAERNLPEFYIPVGSNDVLKSDSARLAFALSKKGVANQIEYYEKQGHAFHFCLWRKQAKECMENIIAFIHNRL